MNSCLIFTMKTTSGEEAREQHTGDSALSFNQVDPGDQTQVLRLGNLISNAHGPHSLNLKK